MRGAIQEALAGKESLLKNLGKESLLKNLKKESVLKNLSPRTEGELAQPLALRTLSREMRKEASRLLALEPLVPPAAVLDTRLDADAPPATLPAAPPAAPRAPRPFIAPAAGGLASRAVGDDVLSVSSEGGRAHNDAYSHTHHVEVDVILTDAEYCA